VGGNILAVFRSIFYIREHINKKRRSTLDNTGAVGSDILADFRSILFRVPDHQSCYNERPTGGGGGGSLGGEGRGRRER
jgi:hypothetical protein